MSLKIRDKEYTGLFANIIALIVAMWTLFFVAIIFLGIALLFLLPVIVVVLLVAWLT